MKRVLIFFVAGMFLLGLGLGMVRRIENRVAQCFFPPEWKELLPASSLLETRIAKLYFKIVPWRIEPASIKFISSSQIPEDSRVVYFVFLTKTDFKWKSALAEKFLSSPNESIRRQAIVAVRYLNSTNSAKKLQMLWDGKNNILENADLTKALVSLVGGEAVPSFENALLDPERRGFASIGLVAVRGKRTDRAFLAEMLNGGTYREKVQVLMTLELLEKHDRAVYLKSLSKDKDQKIRKWALKDLAAMRRPQASAAADGRTVEAAVPSAR